MKILWESHAWEDYVYWQFQDKKTLKKINRIITDICRSPFEGIGKPEPLKENLSGFGAEELMITVTELYILSRTILFV